MSLLFAPGKRPAADDIERLLASSDMAGAAAHVSFRPENDDEGLLELLVSGLTFDLLGLNPAKPCPVPPCGHRFGIGEGGNSTALEAITIQAGQHIASGFAIIPVVQAMAGLAAHIALPLNVEAVCWHSARSWMEPQYFSRVTMNWLSGGAFPALGFTALTQLDDSVVSEGLNAFAGQELQIDMREGEGMAETAKLAVRFIDHVVINGPLRQEIIVEGPDGELLQIERANHGRLVRIRRDAQR